MAYRALWVYSVLGVVQSEKTRFGTRSKSTVFLVSRVNWFAIAIEAILKSIAPIRMRCFLRSS